MKKSVLDTNIILYHLDGSLVSPLGAGDYHVPVIVELELLSFWGIDSRQEQSIQSLLERAQLEDLTEGVRTRTIILRRKYRLSLMDAIICATAWELDANLFSNDQELRKVAEICVVSLPRKSPATDDLQP